MKINQSKSLPVRCHKRLWAWCVKQSEDGIVRVKVLSSDRGGYYLLKTEERKRIGRATPLLTRREHGMSIEWSYVF